MKRYVISQRLRQRRSDRESGLYFLTEIFARVLRENFPCLGACVNDFSLLHAKLISREMLDTFRVVLEIDDAVTVI